MNSAVPPQNLAAEKACLGSIIVDNEQLAEVQSVLDPSDFYLPSHGQAFRAMCEAAEQNKPIDLVMLSSSLKTITAADIAGWTEDALPTNARHYAEEIRKTAKARQLLTAVQKTADALQAGSDGVEQISAELIDQLIAMQQSQGPGAVLPISTAMIEALKLIEKAARGESVGIRTGFSAIDSRTNGHQGGDLIVVAGRSGDGKTIYVTQCCVCGARAGHSVIFVTAEMSAAQIAQRILSTESGVENRDLRRGRVTDFEVAKLTRLAGELGELPIQFLDCDRKWTSIKARLRAEKLKDPNLAIVAVDYAQLIEAPKARERYLEVGAISREAKALARELNVIFYLVSQLNREAEDRRPRKSDLRESGNLEQDADFIGLLFNPVKFDPKQPEDLMGFDVVKNRHGPTGLIKLRFDPRTVSFSDWIENPISDMRTRVAGGE